jgi:hypothetical protein
VKASSVGAILLAAVGGDLAQGAAPSQVPPGGVGVVDVRAFGAACDSVTDDTAAIQAAANALGAAGSLQPLVIPGPCKIGSSGVGVRFPPGVIPFAVPFQGANPAVGPRLICNNQAAYVCVTIMGASGRNGLLASGIEGLSIVGSGGTPVSGFTGLKFYNGYAVWARNIKVTGADSCIVWEAGTVPYGGIAFDGTNVNAAQCKSHYLVFDSWPEARIRGARLGDDGRGDYAAADAILFENLACHTSGCGPNGIYFEQLQLNPGASLGCGFRWTHWSAAGVAVEFKISQSHVEWHAPGGAGVFCSDDSFLRLQGLHVTDTDFSMGGADVPLFAFSPRTELLQAFFTNDDFGGCTGITLAPAPTSGAGIQDVHFTDTFGCAAASFTSNGVGGNRLFLEHNTWGTLAIAGKWDGALYSEDNFSGISDTATGNVFLTEPPQTWIPKLALCPAGMFGCGAPAGPQTASGTYQRTSTGGFTASFLVTMTGPPGRNGYVEVEGLPHTCGSAQGWSGGAATFANGFVNLNSPPVVLMAGVTGSPLLIQELSAHDGSGSALVQLSASNLSSSTHLGATVNCSQTK